MILIDNSMIDHSSREIPIPWTFYNYWWHLSSVHVMINVPNVQRSDEHALALNAHSQGSMGERANLL
jgi:hypothetical protein